MGFIGKFVVGLGDWMSRLFHAAMMKMMMWKQVSVIYTSSLYTSLHHGAIAITGGI